MRDHFMGATFLAWSRTNCLSSLVLTSAQEQTRYLPRDPNPNPRVIQDEAKIVISPEHTTRGSSTPGRRLRLDT